jgi:NADH-quinone oxidoreductase subunit M
MLSSLPILSILLGLPFVGALLLTVLPSSRQNGLRFVALGITLSTFVASLRLAVDFDAAFAGFQFVERRVWWPSLDLTYHVGIDGISLWLVMLSTFLMPICILCSWESIQTRLKEYLIAFLLLEGMMIGTFVALDTVLFYVFFEAILIPMYILIGVWGGPRRVYAAFKFFLYTLLGSVLMLVALIVLYASSKTTDMTQLMMVDLPFDLQTWLWWAFFASFAVKMPMWPVHTWLPDAHVEAPTAGSVILAGVLLKMGGYGFLRFSLPMLPEASVYFAPVVMVLSVVAIVYTSLVALVQTDMKKMIAYSSVAHMGYVTLGLFSFNNQGIDGAMFQMLSHGVVSAALFLCVGVVYDRLHTRDINRYGGLVKNMPRYAVAFMVFTLASVGLPGTSGFVGEFLVLLGAFKSSTVFGTLAATGIVLGATYMLWLYRTVIFGEARNKDAAAMADIGLREIVIFAPLVVLVLLMGVYPEFFMKPMRVAVDQVVSRVAAVDMSEELLTW